MNIPVIGEGVLSNKVEVELKCLTEETKQEINSTIATSSNIDYASGAGVIKTQISVNRTVTGSDRSIKDNEINKDETIETIIKTTETIAQRMTPEDYKELEEEQSMLEQYQLERLDKALSRIKISRVIRKESLQKEIVKNEKKQQQIEKVATHLAADNSYEQRIAERLSDYGIPVTKEKIEKITTALNLFDYAKDISDASKIQLIQSGSELTIDNIYKSSYSGKKKASNEMDEQQWNQIKDQVYHILSENGYELTEETVHQAKWLIQNEIPLNEETLKKASKLQKISNQQTSEHTLEQILCSLLEGTEPEKARLDIPTITEAITFFKNINKIQGKDVDAIVTAGEQITLGTLFQSNHELNRDLNQMEAIKAVRAKRQLEEIRLRLTVENSYQLLKSGVKIDTLPMEAVIKQLKEVEQTYYNQLISEQGKEIKEEHRHLFHSSMHMIEELKTVPKDIIGLQFKYIEDSTVSELHAIGKEKKVFYKKREQSYEALMTTPRSDFGDSIKKAFAKIGTLLSELGLKDSAENQEAVRILAYNKMDLTKESILAVKEAQGKVVKVMEQLKPATVLSLIRQGINPVDMPLKELESILSEEDNKKQEDSFSRYLYELDRKNEITGEERKAFIDIYRTLHQIQSVDGAASGTVLQRNEELSFANLLSAVRNYKSTGVNQVIDDFKQYPSSSENPGEIIRKQIRLAYESQEEQKDFSYEQQKIEQLTNFLKQEDKEPVELIANYDLKQTIETLATAQEITTYKRRTFHQIQNELGEAYIKQFEGAISDLHKVSDYYNEMGTAMKQKIQEACNSDDITYQRLQLLKTNYNCVQLLSSLSFKRYYEVPIITGDTVSSMNITIEPSDSDRGRVRINTELPLLGMVKADLKLQKDRIKGFIISDSRESIETIRAYNEDLKDKLSNLDLKEIVINYGQSENYENKGCYKEQGETIELLYDIAETIVMHIQKIEQKEGED